MDPVSIGTGVLGAASTIKSMTGKGGGQAEQGTKSSMPNSGVQVQPVNKKMMPAQLPTGGGLQMPGALPTNQSFAMEMLKQSGGYR